MRAVNLASLPFVNRRPVIRVAVLVWLLALGLLGYNLWRYGDFFRAASNHRSRLSDLEKEIRIEEEKSEGLRRRIDALRLDEDNSRARYLNGLIHQRIFPWSRLFDEIEDVLPKDVYLTGLAPQIEKVDPVRRANSSSRAAARARAAGKTGQAPRQGSKPVPEKELDRVKFSFEGYARSDDAMLELVDSLYASPTFLDPVLAYERRDSRTGLVSFQIEVTYLTRTRLGGGADAMLAAGEAQGSGEAGEAAGELAGGPGSAPAGGAAGQERLYGQPGFERPSSARGAAARPGFPPAAEQGAGLAPAAEYPAAGQSRGASRGQTGQTGQTGQPVYGQPGQPSYFESGRPGQAPAGSPSGRGEVVVPPRRSPVPLQPVPSSTPRLRAGGG